MNTTGFSLKYIRTLALALGLAAIFSLGILQTAPKAQAPHGTAITTHSLLLAGDGSESHGNGGGGGGGKGGGHRSPC